MMAAARGDRATSIIQARQNARYQNDDSNLSRWVLSVANCRFYVIEIFLCRLQQGNYSHRVPRIPPYQTTPFTIDPSARSTQTFAERYGVSPPHSPEEYGWKPDAKKRNQSTSKVSKEHQTTVIKDNEENSKSFLPNSTAFDVELIQVKQNISIMILKFLHNSYKCKNFSNGFQNHSWITTKLFNVLIL